MTWKTVLLAEIADISLGKMLDKAKNKGEPLPYLANINVRWGDFDLKDLRTMRFEAHELERYSLNAGDIVMCEGGEPGRCALWRDHHHRMMLQKALHRIRPAPQTADSTYLYYYFLNTGKQNGFAPYFTGATIKHLPREQLAKFPIRLPSLSKQQRIGAALSSYDNLITTNQRRIALLEEASRLIYREWFVHMRFPGHDFVDKNNETPEGWTKKPLREIAKLHYGKALKASERKPGKFPVYGSSGIVGYHNTPFVQAGSIIVGRKGNIGSLFYSEKACFPIDTVFFISPEQSSRWLYFALHSLNFISSDSAVPGLNRGYAESLPVMEPDIRTQERFKALTDPLFTEIEILQQQNHHLAQARDLLLPKLMSGQIDVSNIQLPDEDVVT